MTALSYREIHLIRFICSYCTSSTTNKSIYYVWLIIITILCSSHKFRFTCYVIFCNTIFTTDKYIYNLKKYSIADTNQTFKDSAIPGVDWSLWVRSRICLDSVILRQYTTGTNQCYQDLIYSSALVGLSLLCASYYYNLIGLVYYLCLFYNTYW